MFRMLKEARQAGFQDRKSDEYGGEEIQLKGHVLVRNADRAVSRTEWGRRGFKVRQGELPHAVLSGRVGNRNISWEVFRHDQVEQKRVVTIQPPKELPILAALWVVNRHAKRCRDGASKAYRHNGHTMAKQLSAKKQECYRLKSQALHYLLAENVLRVEGYHKFGDNWAEVVKGDGYVFHRPCPPPEQEQEVKELEDIEAKPRGTKDPRVMDAIFTLEEYLKGKPAVAVFEWRGRAKRRKRQARRRYEDQMDADYDVDCHADDDDGLNDGNDFE